MTALLLKDFVRSKSLVAGATLLLITGLLSLYIGGLFLEQQEETMVLAATAQWESIERTIDFVADDDLGLFLYYARFGLANETPRIAGLSVGHRDVHPSTQNVNIRNLEEQRHVSILRNPLYQLLGNLDFSFVLIFLFPLIIIAFCFNVFSEEQEGGTWSLVLSQAKRPEKILHQKFLLRFAAVQLILLLLLGLAKFYLQLPLDAYFLAFTLVAILYLTFWFSLSWFVIRLGKSSSHSALILLLAWVLLTIVTPSTLNALEKTLYPVPEAYEALLESRDGYHNKWDEPKGPTLKKFKEVYPQFAAYDHPVGQSFGWLWYYAMQHLGDVEAAQATDELRLKLLGRHQFSQWASYLFPTAHTQLSLHTISHSDLINYLSFQDNLLAFHETKRLRFYPKVFEENTVSSIDWSEYGTEYFQDARKVSWFSALLPLLVANALMLVLARLFGVPYGLLRKGS
ncbi:MAG: DUF3526 domain-containing protein [Bacteroidota bacterium]